MIKLRDITVAVQSQLAGVSVRGWIAMIVTVVFCGSAAWGGQVDMLKDAFLLVAGFYFGQKTLTNETTTK